VGHPKYQLLYARLSPDNRWLTFTVRTQPSRSRIAIAPVDAANVAGEDAWITVVEGNAEDSANWSPDGKTLYYTSSRDGHNCIWAQRLNPASHHPLGDAFAVHHFHGREYYRYNGWSIAGGRIAIVLNEERGNVWMLSRTEGH
jgi:Tol biopolymer transport system component